MIYTQKCRVFNHVLNNILYTKNLTTHFIIFLTFDGDLIIIDGIYILCTPHSVHLLYIQYMCAYTYINCTCCSHLHNVRRFIILIWSACVYIIMSVYCDIQSVSFLKKSLLFSVVKLREQQCFMYYYCLCIYIHV